MPAVPLISNKKENPTMSLFENNVQDEEVEDNRILEEEDYVIKYTNSELSVGEYIVDAKLVKGGGYVSKEELDEFLKNNGHSVYQIVKIVEEVTNSLEEGRILSQTKRDIYVVPGDYDVFARTVPTLLEPDSRVYKVKIKQTISFSAD